MKRELKSVMNTYANRRALLLKSQSEKGININLGQVKKPSSKKKNNDQARKHDRLLRSCLDGHQSADVDRRVSIHKFNR